MKPINTRLVAVYQHLNGGRRFGHRSIQCYFAAGELLACQLAPTTITPQADAVSPITPSLDDEPIACWVERRPANRSVRREWIFRRIYRLSDGHLMPI